MERPPELPNSTLSLVLGICSIPICFCFVTMGSGFVSLGLGIAAVIMATNAIRLDDEFPGEYRGRENAKAGKITGIIGICLGGLYLFIILFMLAFVGTVAVQDFQF